MAVDRVVHWNTFRVRSSSRQPPEQWCGVGGVGAGQGSTRGTVACRAPDELWPCATNAKDPGPVGGGGGKGETRRAGVEHVQPNDGVDMDTRTSVVRGPGGQGCREYGLRPLALVVVLANKTSTPASGGTRTAGRDTQFHHRAFHRKAHCPPEVGRAATKRACRSATRDRISGCRQACPMRSARASSVSA